MKRNNMNQKPARQNDKQANNRNNRITNNQIKTNDKRASSASSTESDNYCLHMLFDEEGLYYTPMDELLAKYKKRDLM